MLGCLAREFCSKPSLGVSWPRAPVFPLSRLNKVLVLVSWPMNGWRRDVHRSIFPRGRGHGTQDIWQSHLAGPWPCHTTGFPAHVVTKKGWWEAWSHPGPAASLGRAREHDFSDLSFQRWHRVSWARGAGRGARRVGLAIKPTVWAVLF